MVDKLLPSATEFVDQLYTFIKREILPPLGWSEFNNAFASYCDQRMKSGFARVDGFPLLVGSAIHGDTQALIPVASAWVLYLMATRLFDDIQDGQIAPMWQSLKETDAMHMGLFALGAAQSALSYQQGNSAMLKEVNAILGRTCAMASKAQWVERITKPPMLDDYFKTIAAKTGLIVASGAWLGGRVGCSDPTPALLNALYQYGLNMGMMAQILDDCHDLKNSDLPAKNYTLPVIYGLSCEGDKRQLYLRDLLRDEPQTPETIDKIVMLLDEMGAIGWSLVVAKAYQQRAIDSLDIIPPESRGILEQYALQSTTIF
ncbi:MAG: polyprenyl synthetase family protein [Chloroflexi bacterium]|nr:polyprenyl synthetase family protein [Chloroflexota bacterium]